MSYPYADPDYLVNQTDYVRNEAAWGPRLPVVVVAIDQLSAVVASDQLVAEVKNGN